MKPYKEIKPLSERKQPVFKLPNSDLKLKGTIVDEVEVENIVKFGGSEKIYKRLVQKIEWKDTQGIDMQKEQFRFCYYYKDTGDKRDKWLFGQYALMFVKVDFERILKKMKEKGWI